MAPIDFVIRQEEVGIDTADFLEDLASDHQRRSGDPVDLPDIISFQMSHVEATEEPALGKSMCQTQKFEAVAAHGRKVPR